ncbi:MAG: TonB family protein [Lewinella sp.]|nr:TonB family protein [Lewinella sp.]
MMTDYSIGGSSLMAVAALGLGLFVLFILGGRWYLARKTARHLAERANDASQKHVSNAIRKYDDVDVFRMHTTFLYLGLIGVLVVAVSAFNWTNYDDGPIAQTVSYDMDFDLEVEPPPATMDAPPPPPPPPPTVIEEVPKDIIMEEDEIEFIDQSIDANASIDAPVFEEPVDDAPPPPPPPPPAPKEQKVAEIFKIVEEMPRFPGCETSGLSIAEKKTCSDRKLMEYLYSEINYPGIARENNIEGMVVVGFVVNTDGSITDIQVLRDIGAGCGEEAMRVVQKMNEMPQKWIPGRQRNVPVRVMFTLPIRFKLANGSASL